MELFSSSTNNKYEPLASRMRPLTLDEYIGQEHIIGPGRLLRRAIRADQLTSIILYGPPGTGKTTLARVIANTTKSHFITINAVLSGVKQIRETVEKAQEQMNLYNQKTIMFVDEVHRWNKSQQDALLPWVENGTVVLIGATIENPYFEVNRALVSRSRIFQLTPLTDENLFSIASFALTNKERGYGNYNIKIDKNALEHLVHVANGDARSLLNALELAVETTPDNFPSPPEELIQITLEIAEQSIQKKAVLYDKEGDYHFDTISAFIKSLRGSDPDAALYWMAKMIYAGEEPRFIFRRMLIFASEDVGMADPNALVITQAAAAAFEQIGLPEGRFHLAHAALYLSTCPKSNSIFGFFDALNSIEKEAEMEVPNHLRDSSRDSQAFGHGRGYLYPHTYRDHWVAQQYLPSALQGRIFYQPGSLGYEARIKEEVLRKREAQLAIMIEQQPEILTFSPPDKNRDAWLRRVSATQSKMIEDIRHEVFSGISLRRHDRVLVAQETGGLLLWEAFRQVPEGGVYALMNKKEHVTLHTHYTELFTDAERPVLLHGEISSFHLSAYPEIPEELKFDAIIGRNTLTRVADKKSLCEKYYTLLDKKGELSLAEIIPSKTTKLLSLIPEDSLDPGIYKKCKKAEESVYQSPSNILVNWTEADIKEFLTAAGFVTITLKIKTYSEERVITEKDLKRWLDTEKKESESYGQGLRTRLSDKEYTQVLSVLYKQLTNSVQEWKHTILFIYAKKNRR
ncbi:MAG: AAA family ATPase [Spirochaetales bacterium]|nr:AAA family ATPase [Spirochaetales bacterium]